MWEFGRSLMCMTSPDGIHFEPYKIVSRNGAYDSLNTLHWNPRTGKYYVFFRGFHKKEEDPASNFNEAEVRDISVIESEDFENWSEPRYLDFMGGDDYPLYTNCVTAYPGNDRIYVGFPTRYVERKGWTPNYVSLPDAERRKARSKVSKRYGLVLTDTAFMWSRDGVRFNREDEAFLRPGPERPDSWTYGNACAARGLVVTPGWRGGDEEISMYFNDGHWSGRPATLDRYVIRMDGFVSRHATYEPQTLVTKPFTFAGDTLEINFATSARGFLRVEARAADGSAAVSDDLFGDSTHRRVVFVKGDLKTLAGKPVTLTFTMSDADLYSFRFR